MRTMHYLPPGRQQLKSRETLRVYAPLAGLLGMKLIQRELEDLASAIVYPRFDDKRPQTVSERALAAAVVLLPSATRERWLQEWAGELSVLPTRRARARFALQMLRGVPRLAVVLRQHKARRDGPRPMSTIFDRILGVLGIGAAFVAAITRGNYSLGALGVDGRCGGPRRRDLAIRGSLRSQRRPCPPVARADPSLARPCFCH